MRILSGNAQRAIEDHGSRGFTIRGLVRAEQAHVAFASLALGGLIGRHRATVPQLFVVVEGSGWVSGNDGARVEVRAGDAVLWEAGEEHEVGADVGMVALVVESEALG